MTPSHGATDAAGAAGAAVPEQTARAVGAFDDAATTDPDQPVAHEPLSATLARLAEGDGDLTLGAVAARLSDRSFGSVILLFATPNLLPLPPGMSLLFGVPLALMAAQMVAGRPSPRLPRSVARRTISRARLAGLAARLTPRLIRIEAVLRPRGLGLPPALVQRMVGCVVFLLAITLAVPLPLGQVPPATALCVIALGLMQRDGLVLVAGIALGLVAMALVAGVIALALGVAVSVLG